MKMISEVNNENGRFVKVEEYEGTQFKFLFIEKGYRRSNGDTYKAFTVKYTYCEGKLYSVEKTSVTVEWQGMEHEAFLNFSHRVDY